MFAKAMGALAALGVLFSYASCANQGVLEEIEEIDLNGTDPLAFTCVLQNNETEHQTRANAQALTTDFMESTYKAFDLAAQQLVMHRYHVEYKTSGTAWDGTIRPYWDYTQVSGQYAKFWDFSAYPYRFNAVAPYPANPAEILTLTDRDLHIAAPYKMQRSHNGLVSPTDAEPYLVAQLQRNSDGHDYDLMLDTDNENNPTKEIPSANYTRNRYVPLPFHHINSKVRFGIYGDSPWLTANPLYIEDMTIDVASPHFVTQAEGYAVSGQQADNYSWYRGSANSGFTSLTQATQPTNLLRFDGGKEVADNDLSEHQGRSSAFWLQCKQGIMQLPQEDVALTVSFKLRHMDGTLYKEFDHVPIHLEDGTTQYNWRSGYLYTYYLILSEIEEDLEITFTAILTPWEDVTGSLTTDLEQ